MSKCIIGFGKLSKYYLLILGTVICKTLKNFAFRNQLNPKAEGGIFGYIPKLSEHNYVQYFYKYISFIIGGLTLEYILEKKQKSAKDKYDNNNKKLANEDALLKKQSFIYRDDQQFDNYNKREIIITCLAYCISHESIKLLYLFEFDRLDVYTFEILYVLYFMQRYFVINIYNFRKVAIIIITIPVTILLIISASLPYSRHYSEEGKNKDLNAYEEVEKMTGNYFYIIPIFFALLFSEILLSYSRVKAKVLMDLRYISPYMIIFYIGVCGTILILIFLIVLPFIECSESMKEVFCKIEGKDNSTKYIDNPLYYIERMSENNNIYIECFAVIPSFLVLNFVEFLCEILVIYRFNPNYVIIRDNIYYIVIRLFFVIFNYNNYNEYISLIQLIILEMAETIIIFGFCIYLEIIELRFCGLDKYLKRNIIKRAKDNINNSSIDYGYNDYGEENRINNSVQSEENLSDDISDDNSNYY